MEIRNIQALEKVYFFAKDMLEGINSSKDARLDVMPYLLNLEGLCDLSKA